MKYLQETSENDKYHQRMVLFRKQIDITAINCQPFIIYEYLKTDKPTFYFTLEGTKSSTFM